MYIIYVSLLTVQLFITSTVVPIVYRIDYRKMPKK